MAVGDHILLGGDNMDLALAHTLNQQLTAEGKKLDPWQFNALTYGCRQAKETLYGDPKLAEGAHLHSGPGLVADRRHAAHGADARGAGPAAHGWLLPAPRR